MRTIKIFQNASTGAIFNEDGSPLENALTPFVRFPESVMIDYNAINSDDVADAYTGWTGETITAEAIIDNDFDHYMTGALTAAKSGAVTSIAATIANASYVNPTGTLQLVNAAGESETVAYTAFALVSGVYTFTVSATLTYSYAISDECNVADVPLAASYAVDYTDKDTGRLLFSLSANSRPLYELLSGNASLADCVMAIQVYAADGSDPDSDPDIIYAQEFELGVFNIRKYSQAIPPPMNGDYYTKAEVLAIFGGYAALSGAAFTGTVTIGGTALTPATQPTTDEKAAMTAANSPGSGNAFATIADLADPRYLGWYATESALTTAHATGTDGQYAIVGATDTVWTWDSDTSAWVDTDLKGAVTSVAGKTGAVSLVKGDIGLGNVDNTSDANKPVSTAMLNFLGGSWYTVTYAASVTLDSANGPHQKITCTGVINITPPTLSASAPNLDLQISTGGYAISVSSAEIIATGDSKIYLISWYWDGATTRRKTAVEVF